MTKVLTFKPRQQEVRAMRIILGETTRTQILQFCPAADVGVLYKDGVDHETDIRWAYVPYLGDHRVHEMSEDGEWLVKQSDGSFEFLSDAEFHARYEAAE